MSSTNENSERESDWERYHKSRAVYERWLSTKTPAELLELEKLGLDKFVPWDRGFGPPRKSEEKEFVDAADDAIDPRQPAYELDAPTEAEESDLREICEAFSAALTWAGQAKSLVEMGWRLAAMLKVMRPALLEGITIQARRDHVRSLRSAMGGKRDVISQAGDYYRFVLAWCRRCKNLEQLGQRGFAMIYHVKRSAIAGATNALIASLNNKTRQAFNKTVQDFRDSFFGFRNEVMRGERTRIKCRRSQTL